MPSLFKIRDGTTSDDSKNGSLAPVYIAGIAVIGAIALGVILWLTVRQIRIRARRKRENNRGAAFLSVRGVVEDGKAAGPFSRDHLTESVVLPEKLHTRTPPSSSPEEIINYHRQSGTFPQPSLKQTPFSFALNASPVQGRPLSGSSRRSWVSFMSPSRSSHFSVISSTSSMDSSSGTVRKIRQVFNPVLPDELSVITGEKLTVIQSFDDGWCAVGREGDNTFAQPKSLFKQSEPSATNIEIGLVPAWCFIKPVVGLKGERPIRSSSLGITVQMEGPHFSSRDEIISWSNF
ncbi:hypothetical protein D9757_008507 [Collybiopsis confluens]|uniref:SH3 domain-containing protein n=1 Tax=Collybiopsis confluens TaxID=2823264 RepID=A0A8H5LZT7_9AGAR|nr:hypothetical protein D9757_008507 [Collybiopsis confluens]